MQARLAGVVELVQGLAAGFEKPVIETRAGRA